MKLLARKEVWRGSVGRLPEAGLMKISCEVHFIPSGGVLLLCLQAGAYSLVEITEL